jgi:hypothetical protein
LKLECLDCGEGTQNGNALFWQRQYVSVDFAVNQKGLERNEEEVINWDDQIGKTDYECACGSLNVVDRDKEPVRG